jgi:hypothetical protein
MTGPGNHELWYIFKACECFRGPAVRRYVCSAPALPYFAVKTRWYNPGWDNPAVASMFWSLDIGTLHLTMTDTEVRSAEDCARVQAIPTPAPHLP